MRMWMINPKYLCNKHLNGEHGEIHKHRHVFVKKQSIKGRIFPKVLIEPIAMELRHNELAKEMTKRGMQHNSPYTMPDISYLKPIYRYAKVDLEISYIDLAERCEECKKRLEQD